MLRPQTAKKIMETAPAASVWLTFSVIVALSFIRPLWAIYFVIVFAVFWVVRLFYMMIWMVISWFNYRRDTKVNWLAKLAALKEAAGSEEKSAADVINRNAAAATGVSQDFREYYQVITYPTYKEPYEVIRRSLTELSKTNYPKDRMIVAIGGEDRDKENFLAIAEKVKAEFGDKFFRLLITVHVRQPDELPGKGSNVHFMELNLKRVIDELAIPYEKVIVSCFDIETLPHPEYFACLAYHYLTHPRPAQASYQPLILYNNNIWESNPIIRVVASATTFWLLTDLSRPDRLLTFSSHSMSFKMLADVGFHDKTIVTEDSRISLQGLVHYDGDYEVVPLFVTLSMDTVYIGKFWKSLADQYKQMRRWAWGVEHFPWMWANFFGHGRNRRMPFLKRVKYFWNQFEGMYSWAVAPVLILVFGRLPLWLADNNDEATAFFQNAPYTLERLMMVGMVGLILNAILYAFMIPSRPRHFSWWNYPIMLVQWVIFPATMVVFGSIPAIDAQTRLFLGGKWRLGFWVTEKKAVGVDADAPAG